MYWLTFIFLSGILYFLYLILLENTNLHIYKRWYLLAAVFLSVVIPFVTLPDTSINYSLPINYSIVYQPVEDAFVAPSTAILPVKSKKISYAGIALFVYILITAALLFRSSIRIRSLFSLASKNKHSQRGAVTIVALPYAAPPHSFFNMLFIGNTKDVDSTIHSATGIHELTHIRLRHSWDIVFIELIKCIGWFNPFVYLFKKAIQLNHEFQADQAVIKKGIPVQDYQELLFNAYSTSSYPAHAFNFFQAKKRILMLHKKTSTMLQKTKLASALLLGMAILFAAMLPNTVKSSSTNNDTQLISTTSPIADTVPSPTESISENLRAYNQLEDAYLANRERNMILKPTEDKKKQLLNAFLKLTPKERMHQRIIFMKRSLLTKMTVSEKQFNSWKNGKVYGVWINDKKSSNEALSQYKASDISHYFISKLYGKAKEGRSYTHQLDIMTIDYFDKQQEIDRAAIKKDPYHMLYMEKWTPDHHKKG